MSAPPRIIDVHAHAFPADYMKLVAGMGLSGILAPQRSNPLFQPNIAARPLTPPPPQSWEQRIDMMTTAGVERQVLSMPIAPYLAGETDAVTAARLINDVYSTLCLQYPDRFSFWASLPLPHVDAAISEIARSLDQLGASGITLQCFCMNESVVRDEFDPLFAELNRRHGVVFLHPCQNGLCSHLINEWGLTVCAGASFEDSLVAMHLIMKRIPERFPNIRFIVPHFGGILPMLLERLDGQMPQNGLSEKPSTTARKFYYDTVGWGSKAALLCAHAAFGASQLVPGSDWPVLHEFEPYARTFDHIREAGLPLQDVDQILHRNAQALLSL